MIRSAVLIQSTRVPYRRMKLPWHIRAMAYYAEARKILQNGQATLLVPEDQHCFWNAITYH